MNRNNNQAGKDIERLRIEQALAQLEDAVRRCREEDVRDGSEVLVALEFLALHADKQWPFEQFQIVNKEYRVFALRSHKSH